jgi:hypothetical protein
MISKGLNRWSTAMLAGICLNAGIFNLSYFIDSENTLPLQLFIGLVSFFILIRITKTSNGVFVLYAVVFLCIALFNISDPTSVITNPVLPLLGLMTFLAGTQLRSRNQQTVDRTAIIFVALQIILQLFFNFDFSPADSLTGRSKGYGSGTTYALMAAILLIYLTSMFSQRRLRAWGFCALAAVPIWTILLTQSRGVFLSLFVILVVKNLSEIRSLFKLLTFAGVTALVFFLNPYLIESIPLLGRFDFSNQSDLDLYTSGRFLTHAAITNWMSSETSVLSLLLGAEGLNGIKTLASQGFEFPHFDLLYLVYDTGFVGVGVYLFLATRLLVRTRFDSYVLLFFLSSFHTNMLLSPVFLVLSIVLHCVSRQKPKGASIAIERLRMPHVRHSSNCETS